MDKLLEMQNQEEKEERRFKETLLLRNQILSMRVTVKESEEQRRELDKEFKELESQVFNKELQLKILKTQRDNMEGYVRDRVAKVLVQEQELKKSKENFKNNMRQFIDTTKHVVNPITMEYDPHSSEAKGQKEEEIIKKQREVWALRGEVEAMAIYEDFQRRKIEEIRKIKSVIGKPFEATPGYYNEEL